MSIEALLLAAIGAVGLLAVTFSRREQIRKDVRRDLSLAVIVVSLLTTMLSLHVLFVGLELGTDPASAASANGLILSGVLILLVSALAFLFALGVLVWSFTPTATPNGSEPGGRAGHAEIAATSEPPGAGPAPSSIPRLFSRESAPARPAKAPPLEAVAVRPPASHGFHLFRPRMP